MRVSLAFLVWLFSFWTWKAFFFRWFCWTPPSPLANGVTMIEEQLPLSQERQHESKLSRFLSSLPEAKCKCTFVSFQQDSRVEILFDRPWLGIYHDGGGLNASHSEFFAAIASSKVIFHEGLSVEWKGVESCKHMEAFGDVLCQFALRKLDICFRGGSEIQFAKHLSSVVLRNDVIEDLSLEFHNLGELSGKVWLDEFKAYIALPRNLQILKSLKVWWWTDIDGESIEQLVKPFKSPHSRLECFQIEYLTLDVQLEHISDMLATNTSLTTLRFLTALDVFQSGYRSLAVALCSNQSLKSLTCDVQRSVELKALLNPLLPRENKVQCNTTLNKLDLWGNIRGKEGIETLVDMLRTNSSLVEIRFINLGDLRAYDSHGNENVLAILEALKTNTSLKRISFFMCSAVGGYKVLGAMMDLLLENHRIEDIDLSHTPMKESGDAEYVNLALSKRKEMKLWDTIKDMANVSPTSGRVFLCGEPYAGKTRLRKSMKQSWQKEKEKVENTSRRRKIMEMGRKVFNTPKVPKEEVLLERTHGIEVDNMLCDGIGITIWDMAGQTDYHSFHELVMPNLSADGSCSMYLLMCNPMEKSNLFEPRHLRSVKGELEYWLRFIASNTRRSHSYRPHASIVMTHFDYWKDDFEFATRIEDVVKELKSQFEEVLAFHKDKVVFMVNGMDVSHAGGVFDFVKSHLTDLLGRLPKTISACKEVQHCLGEWNANQSNPWLLKWDAFCENMCKDVKDLNNVNHELAKRRKEFVAISLNDGGHIIYNAKAGVVITNPHWFCHDIVGEFLNQCANKNPKLEIVSPNGIISLDRVKHSISGLIGDQRCFDGKFDDVLDTMKKLNICYEQDTMSIMLPSFLNNHEILSWSQDDKSSSIKYIGRRLACKDGLKTMLTPGFFTRLQVSFFKMLPSNNGQDTYKVFPEVIKFITDGIEVILQFNDGDIDILLRSNQPEAQVLIFLDFRIISHIKHLQGDPTLGCLGVRLIEHILRPKCVERLLSPKDRKNQYVHVKDLELEVVRMGVNATHNWKSCQGLGDGFDSVSTLLGSLAWKDLLKRRLHDLQKYDKEVQSLGKLIGADGPFDCKDEKGDIPTPSFWQRSRNLLYGPLDVKLDNIIRVQHEYQKEVMSKLDDVMRSIERLEHGIENLQRDLLPTVCSKMDDLLAFSMEMQKAQFPKLAYLCEMGSQKLLTRLVPGLDSFKLHLMCESVHGFHEVANQGGCVVNFGTDGTKRFLGMVACGLKIATILTKIGAHVACGMGSMVPDFSDGCGFAALILDTPGILDHQIPMAILESLPADERKSSRFSTIDTSEAQVWLRGFLERECQNEREFHEKFKLRKVIYKKGRKSLAWICDKCKKEQCDELH